MGMKPLAVYIHVPFCVRKCDYCDFASYAGRESWIDPYFDALTGEIAAWADTLCKRELHSVFFGGGTPSLVPPNQIGVVLEALKQYAPLDPHAEITLEANPGTLSLERLDAYRHWGVNRLSLGIQSLNDGELKRLGRIHTAEEAREAVRMAREAGFDNVSVDLMYGLPGQNLSSWASTLEGTLELSVKHISAYSLIVEEGTPLQERVSRGTEMVPGDEEVIAMQRLAVDRLARAGFERYEISNYARPGYASRHNYTYWLGGEYLGLGCAAHSLMENVRFHNPVELEHYLAGERMLDRTERRLADRREETLMLSTRTTRGLSMNRWQEEFGEDFVDTHREKLLKLKSYGLVELDKGFLRLTPVGLELQDSVVLELMDD